MLEGQWQLAKIILRPQNCDVNLIIINEVSVISYLVFFIFFVFINFIKAEMIVKMNIVLKVFECPQSIVIFNNQKRRIPKRVKNDLCEFLAKFSEGLKILVSWLLSVAKMWHRDDLNVGNCSRESHPITGIHIGHTINSNSFEIV